VKRILVIGYGNELRGDDGLGPKLACAIDALALPDVAVLVCHQLTPELADPLSRAEFAVFIDARIDGSSGVQLHPLHEPQRASFSPHASDPAALLALSRAVYGVAPHGWWLTLPAVDLGIGEGLSLAAQESFERGLAAFRQLRDRIAAVSHRCLESSRREAPTSV
jgi:hydrogenase maturation protease